MISPFPSIHQFVTLFTHNTQATPQYQAQGVDPEQDKWLDDAMDNVKRQAFFMKRALDGGDIREALKCASFMLNELRTSNLSPKNYYEVYIAITDEMRELESYFEEEDKASGFFSFAAFICHWLWFCFRPALFLFPAIIIWSTFPFQVVAQLLSCTKLCNMLEISSHGS